MSEKFQRIGYLRGIQDSELGQYERAVLTVLAIHCEDDMTLSFAKFTAEKISERIRCGQSTVERAIRVLKDARLLTKVTKRRKQHWKLPTEEAISNYTEPK